MVRHIQKLLPVKTLMKAGEKMKSPLKISLITLLIILSGLISFQSNRMIASSVEESFIKALYTVTYEDAVEYDTRTTEEFHEFVLNELNQADNPTLFPVNYLTFESEYMTNLVNERYEQLVDANYLEKLLINGDLTQLYVYAFEHQQSYSIKELNMTSETQEDDLVKQIWTFTVVELDDNLEETNTWELEALFNRSTTSNLLTFFKLTQDNPLNNSY